MPKPFAVTLSHGPAWNSSQSLEGPKGWVEHAFVVDTLVAEGFVAIGGPLEVSSREMKGGLCDRVPLAGSSRIGRDPVDFPSLPAITRVRLLELDRVRSDARDDESNEDGPLVERVLAEELPASTLELPDRWYGHGTDADVGKMEAPLEGWLANRSSRKQRRERRMVDQSSAGWNLLTRWLQVIDLARQRLGAANVEI
jgi:hypothetical protein